ncbi:hypothetical protein GCM10023340_11210 [Nocardioides marinquilinus]|uniref:Uncharacterized protein n=1 Tax=Nocardioides marinquilinus TaxID=1210400 RepID=A0ABP9PFF9_9ACTN
MRSLLTRGLAALVAAGCLAAVAPAAHAETWRTTDRWHDVHRLGTEDGRIGSPAPRQRAADITALQVDHRSRWLSVTVSLRDVGAHDRIVTVLLDLPGPATGELLAFRSGGTEEAVATLYEPGTGSGCTARTESFPRRGVVRVAVRRDCLGDPAWVRANATVMTGSKGLTERSGRLYLDAALGSIGRTVSDPTYGARVYAD